MFHWEKVERGSRVGARGRGRGGWEFEGGGRGGWELEGGGKGGWEE